MPVAAPGPVVPQLGRGLGAAVPPASGVVMLQLEAAVVEAHRQQQQQEDGRDHQTRPRLSQPIRAQHCGAPPITAHLVTVHQGV